MPFPHHRSVIRISRRNFSFIPKPTFIIRHPPGHRNPGSFSRVGNPAWWVTERKIEVQWEYEVVQFTASTKDGYEVDTQRRGFVSTSRAPREQIKDDEDSEMDWITMRRKVQPKNRGPTVKVDERGFEAQVPREEANHTDESLKMPPSTEDVPGESINSTLPKGEDVFTMPPPANEAVDGHSTAPKTETIFAMPPPSEQVLPRASPANSPKPSSSGPPPESSLSDNLPPPAAPEVNSDLPFPTPEYGIPKDPDADLEHLLPSDIRSNRPSSAETNTWTETFGTPPLPQSPSKKYQTFSSNLSISPGEGGFTYTASRRPPEETLASHIASYLSTLASSPSSAQENENETWTGLDPAPVTLIFLLSGKHIIHISSPPPSSGMPQELKPTEVLDILRPAGLWLPFLCAARDNGGRLVHASEFGVTWEVAGDGWGLVKALEATEWKGEKEVQGMVEEEVLAEKRHERHRLLHPVKVGRKPTVQGERRQVGKKEQVVGGRKKGSTLRRMFWAGVWVGGITGIMTIFGK
ncbi:hypothetical protein BZA77DRAFT_297215 [Pyronema omphalodes]|nr:hypothetical protein BZA77DRAFT_297215 [Pyronema omphalodes]